METNNKEECHTIQSKESDTGGSPIMIRVCYCGTTTCNNLNNQDYPLPKEFNKLTKQQTYEDTRSQSTLFL